MKRMIVESKFDIFAKCVVTLDQVSEVKKKLNSLGLFYLYNEDPFEKIDKVFGVIVGRGNYWFAQTKQEKYDAIELEEISYNELMKIQIK